MSGFLQTPYLKGGPQGGFRGTQGLILAMCSLLPGETQGLNVALGIKLGSAT